MVKDAPCIVAPLEPFDVAAADEMILGPIVPMMRREHVGDQGLLPTIPRETGGIP